MSRATNELASIPFGSLIGGPLNAAIEAQAMAAQTSIDFIQEVGFESVDNGDGTITSMVRTVEFSYERASDDEADNTVQTIKINVPILTIIPIPYLRIETFDIGFTAKIDASSTNSSSANNSRNFGVQASASYGWGGFKAKMSANYSSKRSSKSSRDSKYSVEYTMDINLQAVQDDMPAGMSKVLNILQDSILSGTPD